MEYSRNYIFKRGSTLDQIYQSLIDRTRRSLGLDLLKTTLGFKRRPHTRPVIAITRSRDARGVYDLTTLTVTWGAFKLKIYDKSGRLLRAEVTVNNAKALRCARSLAHIAAILDCLREILKRFMDQVQAVNVTFIGPDELDRWSRPGRAGHRRMAGINLNNARIRTVLSLLPLLSTRPDGFSAADLQEQVRIRGGIRRYTIAQARYDLQKLRSKRLIHRPAHRRRYAVSAATARKVSAYFTLNDDVIRPVLAACARRRRRPSPTQQHPADALKLQMRDILVGLFRELGIAA
jgi:hypothetical protein